MLFHLLPNWKTLSDVALRGQLSTIIETAKTIDADAPAVPADSSAGTEAVPSGLDQLEALADAKEEIEGELAAREEAAAAEETRREEVLGRFADTDTENSEDSEDGQAGEDDSDGETEAAAAGDSEAMASDPPAQTPPETPADPPAPAAAAAEAPAPAAAPSEATRAMSGRRTPTETPGAGSSDDGDRMMRTTSALGISEVNPGTVVDIDRMAELLTDQLNGLGDHHGNLQFERSFRALWNFADDEQLVESPQANYRVFDMVRRGYVEEQEALVASGGSCAPLMPTYNFFQCFSPQRPIEAFLPTLGAPRGGIRYIQPPGLSTAAGNAIDTKTSTELATTPGAGWVNKNCSRVTCPSETTVEVSAISWCVTFDNLNFRVFPEQVRDFLEQVQTLHTRAKEIYYLDRIEALATAAVNINATLAAAYGAARSLYRELVTIAHNYRKRNNMDKDAVLDVFLPDVVEELLAIDMTNDASVGMSVMAGPGGNLAETLARKARLNIGWYYYDSTAAGFPASEHNGVGTAWQNLPTVVRSYVYAPGSVGRLDAGTLDVGPVRDSELNRTNDVELFAEQWIEIANVGCEINSYDHTVCPDGTAPAGATALSC